MYSLQYDFIKKFFSREASHNKKEPAMLHRLFQNNKIYMISLPCQVGHYVEAQKLKSHVYKQVVVFLQTQIGQ